MRVHPVLAKTLIAVLVAGGLWALVYFYEYRGEAGRLEAIESESRLFSMNEEGVSSVEIRTGDGTVDLRKDDAGWSIVRPVETRADQDKVKTILAAATGLRVDESLEDVPGSELGSFGLEAPSSRIALSSDDDARAEVVFGDEVPVTGGYYAMRAGESTMLVVEGEVESLTSATLDSLRYKKVVGVDLWALTGLTLAGGDKEEVRLVREEDAWWIREPLSFPADAARIRELWSGLAWLEAEGVAIEEPGASDLVRMKLEPPVLRLSLETEEEAFDVEFGGADEAGSVFVRRSDLEAVMTVPEAVLERLETARSTVDDLRDRRVADIDGDRLNRIQITGLESPMTLINEDNSAWRLEGRETSGDLAERVDSLLDSVENLQASAFVDDVPQAEIELAISFTERSAGDESEAVVKTVRLVEEGQPEQEDRGVLSTRSPRTLYRVPALAARTLLERVAAINESVEDIEEEKGE